MAPLPLYGSGFDLSGKAFEAFEDRLRRIGTQSQATFTLYRLAAEKFLEASGFNRESSDRFVERIKGGDVDPYKALDSFVSSLMKRGLAPKSVNLYFDAAKRFLEFNGVRLSRERLKEEVARPRPYVVNQDRIPTQEELRKLFYLSNFEQKVILCVLVSTGMRAGEATKIKVEDCRLEEDPPHVMLKPEYTKGRRGRIVLLTEEARELLRTYIAQKGLRPEDRVFPISVRGLEMKVFRLLSKAGLVKKSRNIYEIHLHCFRKYFKTMLAASGVQESFINMLMGHKAYLDESYLRANLEMIKEQYNRAVDKLTLGKAPSESKESKVMKVIQTLGLDPKEVFNVLKSRFNFEVEISKLSGVEASAKALGILDLLYVICPEEVEEAIRTLLRRRARAANCNGGYIIVRGEEELLAKLDEGCELVKELSGGRYLLKAP